MIKVKDKFEKESFLKAFILFFSSMFLLIGTNFIFHLKTVYEKEKNFLFLDMKNFSYSFKGEKYDISLVTNVNKKDIYELKENKEEFYMYIPIPHSKNEFLKISYPKSKFNSKFTHEVLTLIIFYALLIIVIAILAIIFSFYALFPLKKAYNLLDEGIKDIVHDINTPLTSAKINLSILRSKYEKDEDFNRLYLSIDQLANLQENLILLNQERKKYIIEKINLKKLIEEKISFLSRIYPNIQVKTHLEPIWVKTDKKLLDRVILNLLTNAFKHNKDKGEVEIYLKQNELVIKNQTSEPIKNINNLTKRYYKESQRGLGLGLAIVKSICEELSCSLTLEYKDNKFIAKLTFPESSLLQTGG